jgi:3-oxoadipate enol-lactonase
MAKFLGENGISVVILDNRGSGQTKAANDEFSIPDMATDVAALWNHLQLHKTALLGISMGGVIAQCLAEMNAERVDKLILVSTCFKPSSVQTNRDPWPEDIDAIMLRLAPNFSAGFRVKNKMLIQAMAKNIAAQISNSSFVQDSARQRRAMDRYAASVPKKSKSISTLIIHGSGDEVIHVDSAKELQRYYAGARLDIVEDVGHLLIAECPKILYQKVADFVLEA